MNKSPVFVSKMTDIDVTTDIILIIVKKIWKKKYVAIIFVPRIKMNKELI